MQPTSVRALLAGTKSQTRRILKPQPPADMGLIGLYAPALTAVFGYVTPDADHKIPLRFMPKDRLWVREAWRTERAFDGVRPRDLPIFELPGLPIFYEENDNGKASTWGNPWGEQRRPSMFMPRWASRLTLIVTGVKVERLQDISEEDALAEGIASCEPTSLADWCTSKEAMLDEPVGAYALLWDRINGSGAWEANPWVVALTFAVHKQNIDALKEVA